MSNYDFDKTCLGMLVIGAGTLIAYAQPTVVAAICVVAFVAVAAVCSMVICWAVGSVVWCAVEWIVGGFRRWRAEDKEHLFHP